MSSWCGAVWRMRLSFASTTPRVTCHVTTRVRAERLTFGADDRAACSHDAYFGLTLSTSRACACCSISDTGTPSRSSCAGLQEHAYTDTRQPLDTMANTSISIHIHT